MVTTAKERRSFCCSSLERIKELAAQEIVVFESRRVEHRAAALGYSFSAVCKCIAELRPEDFAHAVRYRNVGAPWTPWLDVYRMSYELKDARPSGESPVGVDDLYIKLRLGPNCLVICLHSFHREGDL